MISHDTFMKIAYAISEESYCKKRQVGAIIVKDNSIIAVGYNGTPSGFENCCEESKDIIHPDLGVVDVELKTRPEVLHAESNAISKCAKSTLSSEGAEIYTTTAPCLECAKLIIQSGITHVYYAENYKNHDGIELLRQAGILVEKIEQEKTKLPESLKRGLLLKFARDLTFMGEKIHDTQINIIVNSFLKNEKEK